MTQSMVIYSDGGCSVNPGPAGYGFHGYLYSNDKPKKGAGNTEHIPTANGYSLKTTATTNKLDEVTLINYVDGYGSIANGTNNIAELLGCINGIRHAINYTIDEVHIFTDSKYVCKGLESWADGWAKNNWIKHDGTPPANVDYWKQLLELRNILSNRGTKVKISWVKGHSDTIAEIDDELGNIQADKLATIGVTAASRGISKNEVLTSIPAGYWKPTIDRHPFINNSKVFFNTGSTNTTPGEYYLGECDRDESLFGKKTADGAFSVIKLSKPDHVIEMIKRYQSSIASNIDSICMIRLDKLFKPNTYSDLIKYGELSITQSSYDRLDLRTLDKEPLTREFKPPKLCMIAVEHLNFLLGKLIEYKNKESYIITTDITDIIFEHEDKVDKKGNVTTTLKLKSEFTVGFAALKINVNYQSDIIKSVPVTLTLGLDILDRNGLKHLESLSPKVTVISWLEAPTVFRYATIIEIEDDIGIWASCNANTRILSTAELA